MTRISYAGDFVFTIIPAQNDIVSSNFVIHRVPSPLVAEHINAASGQEQ
jgi:hypothetical protein